MPKSQSGVNGEGGGEVWMNFNCENCGWSEIDVSPIMCNYSGHRTWRDECCEAWKPKEKETKMVEVVRCKDCKYWQDNNGGYPHRDCKWNQDETPDPDDFCSAGERRNDDA